MTRQLAWSLIADGGTDRALEPIIRWAIGRLDPTVEVLDPEFRKRHGSIPEFLDRYETGAMLTFVHRDAESMSLHERLNEFDGLSVGGLVPVVPMRMTEAWLFIDAEAIASAAGAPSSDLTLPKLGTLESIPDPKAELERLLKEAAGPLKGRRLKKFASTIVDRRVDVASRIRDFSPLEQLDAFRQFQGTLAELYPYSV